MAPCSDLVRRGRAYLQQRNHHDAELCFRKAHEFDSFAPEPLYRNSITLLILRGYEEGILSLHIGNFHRALECLHLVERLAPGWYKVRSYLWLTQQLVRMTRCDDIVVAW